MLTIRDAAAPCAVGQVIDFVYPTDNRIRVATRLERRRIFVRSIRDLQAKPLHPQTLELRPDLRRSRFLVKGWDWKRRADRSFYTGSARSLAIPSVRVLRLGVYDPLDDLIPPQLFGQLWMDDQASMRRIRQIMKYFAKLTQSRPTSTLSLGVFQVSVER